MKQFHEEVRHLCHWCFCCPYTDMAEQIEREEKGQTEEKASRSLFEKYNIKNGYKRFWIRFDGIFKEKDGSVISFRSFLQSYRDQEQKN